MKMTDMFTRNIDHVGFVESILRTDGTFDLREQASHAQKKRLGILWDKDDSTQTQIEDVRNDHQMALMPGVNVGKLEQTHRKIANMGMRMLGEIPIKAGSYPK